MQDNQLLRATRHLHGGVEHVHTTRGSAAASQLPAQLQSFINHPPCAGGFSWCEPADESHTSTGLLSLSLPPLGASSALFVLDL